MTPLLGATSKAPISFVFEVTDVCSDPSELYNIDTKDSPPPNFTYQVGGTDAFETITAWTAEPDFCLPFTYVIYDRITDSTLDTSIATIYGETITIYLASIPNSNAINYELTLLGYI